MVSLDYSRNTPVNGILVRKSFSSDNIRLKALAMASIKAGETAADIGAGTGYISEILKEKGVKVYALMKAPKCLKCFAIGSVKALETLWEHRRHYPT